MSLTWGFLFCSIYHLVFMATATGAAPSFVMETIQVDMGNTENSSAFDNGLVSGNLSTLPVRDPWAHIIVTTQGRKKGFVHNFQHPYASYRQVDSEIFHLLLGWIHSGSVSVLCNPSFGLKSPADASGNFPVVTDVFRCSRKTQLYNSYPSIWFRVDMG